MIRQIFLNSPPIPNKREWRVYNFLENSYPKRFEGILVMLTLFLYGMLLLNVKHLLLPFPYHIPFPFTMEKRVAIAEHLTIIPSPTSHLYTPFSSLPPKPFDFHSSSYTFIHHWNSCVNHQYYHQTRFCFCAILFLVWI